MLCAECVLCEKAALGSLQQFYRLFVCEWESKGKGGNSGIKWGKKKCLEPQNCTQDKLERETPNTELGWDNI